MKHLEDASTARGRLTRHLMGLAVLAHRKQPTRTGAAPEAPPDQAAGSRRAVLTDVAGNPSESRSPAALNQLRQAWNLLAERRIEATMSEVAEMVAIERRVAASLYPQKGAANIGALLLALAVVVLGIAGIIGQLTIRVQSAQIQKLTERIEAIEQEQERLGHSYGQRSVK